MSQVVLVIGPHLSGVRAVVEALRSAPEADFLVVGAGELEPDCVPDAVLGVVSAAAPVTASDWALVERAAARTDLVIGVVSKIDAHRSWRDVMEADRTFAARDVRRGSMPWVGVAAAPDLGEPRVAELVDLLREGLADPELSHRNMLLRKMVRPATVVSRVDPVALRSALALVRLGLLRSVRDRCAELRTELRGAASAVPVGGSAAFEASVTSEAQQFLVALDREVTRAIGGVAAELGLDGRVQGQRAPVRLDVSRPPSSSRRLEGRLMTVLGVGFGLGIALASSRLLAGVAPGLSAVGMAVGAVAGSALVLWVVRVRGLLHDRALLDRWVTEVGASLRWHGEAMVAERLLEAETEWLARGRRRPRDEARRCY
ncbi:MAG: hypothetical protein QOJ95_691 [Mycobacterium sp.]|nr:hypothetical protein [Mycobacterium sp.]